MIPLTVNDNAPKFSLSDQNGQIHHLQAYQGKWVVLFFYPKDQTPGCTIEACQFRDYYAQLTALDIQILGINTDSVVSHQAFACRKQLPYPLLADTEGRVAKVYGALFQWGFIKFCKRYSFIINPDGKIVKIYIKVNVKTHALEVLEDLKILKNSQ